MQETNPTESANIRYFTYPKRAKTAIPFIIFSMFMLFYCGLFLPYLDYNDIAGTIWQVPFLLIFALIAYSSIGIDLTIIIKQKFKPVAVDDSGIMVGRRRLDWENLRAVKHGFSFNKNQPLITLVSDKSPISFWSLKIFRKDLTIAGYFFVYQDIIPLIQKHRPDIVIPKSCLNMLKNLPARTRRYRLIIYSIGMLELLLLAVLVKTVFVYMPFLFFLSGYLFYIISIIGFNMTQLVKENSNDIILKSVIICTGVFTALIDLSYFAVYPPFWIIQGGLTAMGMILFLSLLAKLSVNLNSLVKQLLFYIILSLSVMFSLLYFYLPTTTYQDISPFFSGNYTTLCWDRSGRYISDSYTTEEADFRQYVFDTQTASRIELPYHNHKTNFIYMDSSIIIRVISATKDSETLWIYNLLTKKEIKIAEGDCLHVSNKQPISPDKTKLIWLNHTDNEQAIINITSLQPNQLNSSEQLPVKLPDNYWWSQVNWLDNNEIIIRGYSNVSEKNNLEQLTLFRYNIKTKQSSQTTSEHRAKSWYVTDNYRYALTESGCDTPVFHYVNLMTNKVKKLKGDQLPSWVSDKYIAYRTLTEQGEKYLSAFDLTTGIEDNICKIPSHLNLIGVSRDGSYAAFTAKAFLMITPATVTILNIKTNKWSAVSLKGLGIEYYERGNLVLSAPKYSIWSPTKNIFIMQLNMFHFANEEKMSLKVIMVTLP